ncbi:TRAM domain-containing protein [Natrialba hulunbeirensis JCM 10989]|uniref:TRAM domain-containing protein n=1 Tax=Natrialba hulunbeirensis JCM 10989 TaxID=1227493 RepID=M0A4W7_9EURY|nr:TRAM domain-containing protein [Natrialba hulunbeirensis]ELY93795.1 TRAM domain-containing protein [Natrialba hulunbeirensis JCM 10989]
MSIFTKYLKGWQFRDTTPSLTVGDELDVFVAEANSDGNGHVYIGDTHLLVEGAGQATVEKRVRVRVTEFDEEAATGRGEFIEIVGESSYTS